MLLVIFLFKYFLGNVIFNFLIFLLILDVKFILLIGVFVELLIFVLEIVFNMIVLFFIF